MQSKLDSVREALADPKNFDALGYGLYLKGDISTLVSVVEAAEWYQDRRDAVRDGRRVRDMDEACEALRIALVRATHKAGRNPESSPARDDLNEV